MKKIVSFLLALTLVFSLGAAVLAAPTIDPSQSASLNIYKYDLTRAEQEGGWQAGSHAATGQVDPALDAISGYAIQGVKFAYLKIADLEAYTQTGAEAMEPMLVYGLTQGESTDGFLSAIGLDTSRAHHTEGTTCYFTSEQLTDALTGALAKNATGTRDTLESLVVNHGGIVMAETDQQGHASASDMAQGLYLLVETSVPENITGTTDPFLVSLPMTTVDGTGWNYHVVVYPKNRTGEPTLDKTVRESSKSTGTNGGTDAVTDGYAHAASASIGDILEYQILSTLPAITSAASYLTQYTLTDTLSKGLQYTKGDVAVSFFRDTACTQPVTSWTEQDNKFTVTYQDEVPSMTIALTEEGLGEVNTASSVHGTEGSDRGYSGCTMRVTYTCALTGAAFLGDPGNPNTATLTWRRTNTDYEDTKEDDSHVHTWGLDITKEFSDSMGNMDHVQMILRNETDGYYVKADLLDGAYTVTGTAADAAGATVFTPTEAGKILIRGLEEDEYSLTEVQTDNGYVLLKDPVKIVITKEEGGTCPVCGEHLYTASASVNGESVEMTPDGESAKSMVPLKIVNVKGFNLPQTGSNGIWMYTCAGVVMMAAAVICLVLLHRRRTRRG